MPFLDILIIRNQDNSLEFDIYRKPTNNNRFIPSDSFHPTQHKHAAFNSMVYRALNYPLTAERRTLEIRRIKDIAELNGFSTGLVDKLVHRFQSKIDFKNATTFRPTTQEKKYAKIPYYPNLHKGLNSLFKKVGVTLAHSNPHNIRSLLGNPKSKETPMNKSGIYEISCVDCEKMYIGQTKRKLVTRFKEHIAHFKYNRRGRSSVADHIFDTGHRIFEDNVKLVKEIHNSNLLNAFESITIAKVPETKKLNSDNGPLENSILIQSFVQP